MQGKSYRTDPKYAGKRVVHESKKFHIGLRYIGRRTGSAGDGKVGTLVEMYATVNGSYLNPAYVLLCDDGKERSYQFIVLNL